jgi:GcrA cell cycle regulator
MKTKNWLEMGVNERLEAVGKLAEKGLSAKQISEHFKNASRNAIIGFCHRQRIAFGMAKKKKGAEPVRSEKRRPPKSKAERKPAPVKKEEVEPEIVREVVEAPPIVPEEHGPVSILQLSSHTCRWPNSESYIGLHPDKMMFCGSWTDGSSFCVTHSRLAYAGFHYSAQND